jgi:acetylornithine deacetylase/succinyl-diaminopimelate desuccinylase-like protein
MRRELLLLDQAETPRRGNENTGRQAAIDKALKIFDTGAFQRKLAELISIPSTSQDEDYAADVARYLQDEIRPWLERMGFTVEIHPNSHPAGGPILVACRIEDPALPTVLTYGHGDTVRGLDEQWRDGLSPWVLKPEGDLWYGRGSADNKGQHVINLMALEAVLAQRLDCLGYNVKMLLEMSEERGSLGLGDFVATHRAELAADVLLASDGPRVAPETPTIATGTRGSYQFDLVVSLRSGGVHSGHWGGLIADPALILAQALASICDRKGRLLVRDWLPPGGVPASVKQALQGCVVGGGGGIEPDPDWGEPGLTAAEKIYGWNSFIVLAMTSGRPENPVSAVAGEARAHCQIRYVADVQPETFVPALRKHLDAAGFPEVAIEGAVMRRPASRTDPANPWVQFAAASMKKSLGRKIQVIPSTSGGLPGDMFMDHLGVPLIWVPHSYNGCKQHGPDEHLLAPIAREGFAAFAGLWWDLGDGDAPASR